jgi:hydrogenase maturation protein HypF
MIIDPKDIFRSVIQDINKGLDKKIIAAKFHNTIVEIAVQLSKKLRDSTGYEKIALSGGVFQNSLLLSKLYDRLHDEGFAVYINEKVPVNDGGISLGQAYLAMKRLMKGES